MYFDGSWSITNYKDVPFTWSVFAPPPPKGMKPYVCFHIDAGLAMNSKTKYPTEARTFLQWIYSDAAADTIANGLPTGFFPMAKNASKINEVHANAFLQINVGRGTDVRLTWPKLMTAPSGDITGYNLFDPGDDFRHDGKDDPQGGRRLRPGRTRRVLPASDEVGQFVDSHTAGERCSPTYFGRRKRKPVMQSAPAGRIRLNGAVRGIPGLGWMLYILPALLVYVAFMVFPVLNSMRLSFYTGSGYQLTNYVGFDNFVKLFNGSEASIRFLNAFKNTWIFFAIHMLVQNSLGLLFALLLSGRLF